MVQAVIKCLDLYAGQGGAGEGYRRAGFDIYSVELDPEAFLLNPHHGEVGDALEFVQRFGEEFDFIHASPPCQYYTALNNDKSKHVRSIPPIRRLLQATGKPYVIENVEGARWDMLSPITLCGSMFGLGAAELHLKRHRLFETNWPVEAPQDSCKGLKIGGVYGNMGPKRAVGRGTKFSLPEAEEAMGIDWMDRKGLAQAIPPDYTEYIGHAYIEWLVEFWSGTW